MTITLIQKEKSSYVYLKEILHNLFIGGESTHRRYVLSKKYNKYLKEIREWTDLQAEHKAKEAFQEKIYLFGEFLKEKKMIAKHATKELKRISKLTKGTEKQEKTKKFVIKQYNERKKYGFGMSEIPKRLSGKVYKRRLIKRERKNIIFQIKNPKKEKFDCLDTIFSVIENVSTMMANKNILAEAG